MKIAKKISLFIMMFLCLLPISANAKSYYGVVTGAGVKIRRDPNVSTNPYKLASSGETFDLVDNELVEGNSACPNGWYKVKYKETTIGYICSNYLKVYEKADNIADGTPANSDCEKEMQQKGFPSSYWPGLCSLKQNHPNWEFNAITKDVNGNSVDWNMSVNAESSCGKNTISTSNDSYKDLSCQMNLDSGYSPVSREAVKYYLDPRNFLNEANIFMFESHDINNNISEDSYKTSSTRIFGSSFLIEQIPNLPEFIKNASKESGVSQMAIATRIKQELGDAKLTSGEYKNSLYSVVSGDYSSRYNWTYNGASVDNYYNFFNVAATDGSNVTQKALIYAYNHGWGGTGDKNTDRQIAVTKGSQFLGKSYTSVGQNTVYFQKFNIFPTTPTSRYLHQYMTNIQAPVSESKILYNAYKDTNLLNAAFKFYIPVYSGMNVIEENNESSNDNQNQNKPNKKNVETIVNETGFRYNNGYISKINVGTSVNDLKNALSGADSGCSITITDANGASVDGSIATGYRININGSNSETLIAVVYGDVSGDGKINALDLLKVQKNILGTSTLNGSYKEAADPSHDGNINALDLLKIQKNILGNGTIEQ